MKHMAGYLILAVAFLAMGCIAFFSMRILVHEVIKGWKENPRVEKLTLATTVILLAAVWLFVNRH